MSMYRKMIHEGTIKVCISTSQNQQSWKNWWKEWGPELFPED